MNVKAIRCPKCNAPINLVMQDAETAACAACGAVCDLESSELKVLSRQNVKEFAPESFLRLGMLGTIDGKKCQIIGRICYESQIREWDSEDNAYSTEPWTFDTWMIVNEDKSYLYISEDREGYEVSEAFTPSAPGIPEPGKEFMSLIKGQSPSRIQEFGSERIKYFEGEFTWRPQVGDRSHSACYKIGDLGYEVSWRTDSDGKTVKEVEFFRTRPIEKRELAHSFGREDLVEQIDRQIREGNELGRWSYGFFAAAAVLLLLLFSHGCSNGREVVNYAAQMATITEDGQIFGPFSLKKVGQVHEMRISGNVSASSWAWGGVELLNADYEPLNVIEHEFWRESGYDSEGSWSESSLSQNQYFRLDNPGSYYIKLIAERGTSQSGTVRISIHEGVGLVRYYLIAFLFCLGFGYSVRKNKSLNPVLAVVGLFVLVLVVLAHFNDD